MKTWEGVPEFLSTGAIGHSPQTGAVPVELPTGKHYAVEFILGQGRDCLRIVNVLFCHKNRDVLPCESIWWSIHIILLSTPCEAVLLTISLAVRHFCWVDSTWLCVDPLPSVRLLTTPYRFLGGHGNEGRGIICAVYTSFAHLCCHFQVLKCYRLLHRACRKAFQGDHVTLQGIYSIQYKNTSKIAALCTCTCSFGAIVEYNNIMQLPESDWRKNFGKIVMSLIQSSCPRYRYHAGTTYESLNIKQWCMQLKYFFRAQLLEEAKNAEKFLRGNIVQAVRTGDENVYSK